MSSKFHGANSLSHAPGDLTAKPITGTGNPKGRKSLLTDAQILELRALSEFAGWDRDRLAARYGVDLGMVYRVISGMTCVRLVATRKHLPEDA